MRIRGKFHKHYLFRSIGIRLSAAFLTAGLVITGTILSQSSMFAKAAFFTTDENASFFTPACKQADFNQTTNISEIENYPIYEQTLTTTKSGIYYYEPQIKGYEIVAKRDDEELFFENVELTYQYDNEYIYIPTAILNGNNKKFNGSGVYVGEDSRTYSSSWNFIDGLEVFDVSTPLTVTYSATKPVTGSGMGIIDISNEKLGITYTDSTIFDNFDINTSDLDGYRNDYIWENSISTVTYTPDNNKPLDKVRGNASLINDYTDICINNNNSLEYQAVLDGTASYTNTSEYVCEDIYIKKSELQKHVCDIDISSTNYNTLRENYAIASFNMPYTTSSSTYVENLGFVKLDVYDEYLNSEILLLWDGEKFYTVGNLSCGKLTENWGGQYSTRYTCKAFLKDEYEAREVSPANEDLVYSGPITAKYNNKSTNVSVKYTHPFDADNKQEFELVFKTQEKYYKSTPEYYVCNQDFEENSNMYDYNPDYNTIIQLDRSIEKLKLAEIENTRLIDVLPGKKYKILYDDVNDYENNSIYAVIYEKNNTSIPIYFGCLGETISSEGEVSINIPTSIISGEYLLGIFNVKKIQENNKYLKMSLPIFAELIITESDNGKNTSSITDDYIIENGRGSLTSPMVAQDKYGIWWNYTTQKEYRLIYKELSDEEAKEYEFNNIKPEIIGRELVDEYIDHIWLTSDNTASIQALNIALNDESTTGMNHTLVIPDTLTDDKIKIKAIGGGTSSTPVVPKEINDFNTIRLPGFCSIINDFAFYENSAEYELLLTDSIEEIGAYSFGYNSHLKKLQGVGNELKISKYAFVKCDSLEQVYLDYEKSLNIGFRAFYNCVSIRQSVDNFALYLCGNYLTVDNEAFRNTMQSNMGAHVKFECSSGIIKPYAFKNALNKPDNLYNTIVDLTDYSGDINEYAFDGASGIKSLYVPVSVRLVDFSFANLDSLSELEINTSKIPANSFSGCSHINSIIFDNNVLDVDSNWAGDKYSGTKLDAVNYYIENPDTKFEFVNNDNTYNSAFGITSTNGVNSREIKDLLLFYNTNTQGQTATIQNGTVTHNLLGLNMSLGSFEKLYSANNAIESIHWIPADQFAHGDFGYLVSHDGMNYIPNVDIVKRPSFNTRPIDTTIPDENKEDITEDDKVDEKTEGSEESKEIDKIEPVITPEDSITDTDESINAPNGTTPNNSESIDTPNNTVPNNNDSNRELATLKEEINNYRLTVDSLKSKIADLENKNSSINQYSEKILASNDEIKAKNDEIKAENDEIKAENNRIKTEIDTIKDENNKIKVENTILSSEYAKISKMNDDLSSQNKKIIELNDKLNAVVKDITTNKTEQPVKTVTGTISIPESNKTNTTNKTNTINNSNKPNASNTTGTTTTKTPVSNSSQTNTKKDLSININTPVSIITPTNSALDTNSVNEPDFNYYITEDGQVVFLDDETNTGDTPDEIESQELTFLADDLELYDDEIDSVDKQSDEEFPVVNVIIGVIIVVVAITIFIFMKKKNNKLKNKNKV